MISLLTHPDISYTGFSIVMLNSKPELQSKITTAISYCYNTTNVVLYDLRLDPNQLDYNLSVLATADIIIYENPDLSNWITGFVLSKLSCYYWENNSESLNKIYKISLRELSKDNIGGVIDNAIQRKCNPTLQLLPEDAKRSP